MIKKINTEDITDSNGSKIVLNCLLNHTRTLEYILIKEKKQGLHKVFP